MNFYERIGSLMNDLNLERNDTVYLIDLPGSLLFIANLNILGVLVALRKGGNQFLSGKMASSTAITSVVPSHQ